MNQSVLSLIALAGIGAAVPAAAQSPVFQTPGMPIWAASGQVDRFSNDFNPAIGALIDGFGDYLREGDSEEDGVDLYLRTFEMTVNGRVDPNWYGYAVVVYEDEEVELEEAAVTYGGFDSNTTIRFGRFFIDFGKQMQAHQHDLPYPERPGVLAEYLGTELPGIGVQGDHWWATGDSSALRASLAIFGEMELGEEDVTAPDRRDLDELGLTARITQFMDVGERGVFQWGTSLQHSGGFGLVDEATGDELGELERTTYGIDLTYGVDSEDGLSGWTFGAEGLVTSGDLGLDSSGAALASIDDDRSGFYIWGERRAGVQDAYGLLLGSFERLGGSQEDRVTAYYTRFMSEFARLRFAASHAGIEGEQDSTRLLVQLTTFFGPHAHGVNW